MKKYAHLLPFLLLFLFFACSEKEKDFEQLSEAEKRKPENALLGLETNAGIVTQLFAAEPVLINPTNIDVDAKGRVWLCEGYNYRMQLNPNNPSKQEGDRILILEDTNGDGKADKTKVFYQGTEVNSALGICVLGSKIIVSSSPYVFVFDDSDGDDKPNSKDTLFVTEGGFQNDHGVHAITFGPDGKLYFNFGNGVKALLDKKGKALLDAFGKPIAAEKKPFQEGMAIRCNVDGTEVEVLGYNFRNSYEVAVDSYGTAWQSDNDDDGNKGVRINYVMEYGNFGYKDQISGAGWQARRTNMESEIPKRHWHLNDPGVIPNLLQTGAGSPAGILVYEGTLLPKEFQNQLIHADAGPNVVRAYPVENDGAGYKAGIINILQGTKDQWFRPSDVCVAPDGSLIVADWYDPGVGGHQVVDLNKGRLYRITIPSQKNYTVPTYNLSTPEKAAEALKSPNMATRYLAWTKLHNWQKKAETALANVWKNDNNPRMKARALWLLSKIKGKGEKYIKEAIKSDNSDLCITAIRAGRQLKMNMLPLYQKLSKSPSPQIRREIALTLRNNQSDEAKNIWVELALQYDGKDRWYLEALGIGADEQWDKLLPLYLEKAKKVNQNAKKDIIWRSRAENTPELLAQLIGESKATELLRYFRAFDFQQNNPTKSKSLLALLEAKHPEQAQINNLVLRHLDPRNVPQTAQFKQTLAEALTSAKGTLDFVDLVRQFAIKEQFPVLLENALNQPDSSLGIESAKTLLQKGGIELLEKSLNSKDVKTVKSVLTVLGHLDEKSSKELIFKVINNKAYQKAIRILALEKYGTGWGGQEALWELVKNNELPEDLDSSAKQVLTTAWRADVRANALKYYREDKTEKSLSVAALLTKKGDALKGKKVFAQVCATCHQIGNEGLDFGPKLSTIGSKLPKEGLYQSILSPNAGISFGYEGFIFKLKNGNTVAGIIASETDALLEIKQVGGNLSKIQKSEVQSKKAYKGSLMPTSALSETDLVDLVEFLSALK